MSSLVVFTENNSVILRQLRPEHAADYFEAVDANRDHLSQFGDDTAAKYPDLQAVEASIVKPSNPSKLRFGIWATGAFVGSINATPRSIDEGRGAEIGYWLHGRQTGHGYATTAVKAVSSYVIDHFGQPYARVSRDNIRSIGVLERAGFVRIDDQNDDYIYELPEETP